MLAIPLDPDCANCAALCCVALAFDKSDDFAIDKPASKACPNLAQSGLCTIHRDLAKEGFSGCIQFNCNGAGQRVTQELFDGKSWQDDPDILEPMSSAFLAFLKIHECLLLLREASRLPLDDADRNHLNGLVERLERAGPDRKLAVFHKEDVQTFLSGLRKYIPR